jgi:hypothetical protein
MRLIDADALYEKVQHDEELARNRVLDTESTLSYPNNLNPSYTRYVAQMDERTRLKEMVADAPTIEPERKTGKWILLEECANAGYYCSECRKRVVKEGWSGTVKKIKFCPNCGADMRSEAEREIE